MSTISKAYTPNIEDKVCQGDVFKNVRFNYIDSEDDVSVDIVEYEFPLAVVISQACDVTAMSDIVSNGRGKPTKFMPSILLCPIYDKGIAKSGEYVEEAFETLSLTINQENIYSSKDWDVVKNDWHYRFHALDVENSGNAIISNALVDFKHYFSVPMSYLISHREDRILRLEDAFAEQLTLKFATFLSRVAIPD